MPDTAGANLYDSVRLLSEAFNFARAILPTDMLTYKR